MTARLILHRANQNAGEHENNLAVLLNGTQVAGCFAISIHRPLSCRVPFKGAGMTSNLTASLTLNFAAFTD
jgi:hypothetical protein